MRAAEFVLEKWTAKYKRSIDCSHPRGFSQRAHCAGRKKNEDINQGVAEGWSGAIAGGGIGLLSGPVGALLGAVIGHALQEKAKDNIAKVENLMGRGEVFQVYFDGENVFPDKLFNYGDAFNVMSDLAKKPHNIEKYFDVVDSTNGQSVFKYRAKVDASNFIKHYFMNRRDKIRQDIDNQNQQALDRPEPTIDLSKAVYKNVNYFSKEFVDRVERIAKSNKWDILRAAGYLQELSNDSQQPFGHPADWVKLKSMVGNDYNTESLRTLGQRLKQEFKKSKNYYSQGVAEEQLDELTFKGSQCTKDCSGHRAGYDWSQRKGGQYAASWSPSFNNGAALFKNGF